MELMVSNYSQPAHQQGTDNAQGLAVEDWLNEVATSCDCK